MTLLDIDQTHKKICQRLLTRASHVGRFTKKEFQQLDQVIEWFNNPNKDFSFSFSINQRHKGESLDLYIVHDGLAFWMEQSTYVVEHGYGGDRVTLYDYRLDDSFREESGDVFSFEDTADMLLNEKEQDLDNDEISEVELSISVEQ